MVDSIKPIYRHLKPEYLRKRVGIDCLTITPTDKFGNTYLFVFVVHFSKLSWGYPSSNKSAQALADSIVTFFSIYGLFEEIASDPGSDLTSGLIEYLVKYYGIGHRFSLVNRHESNGVEGTNKQILRHARCLTQEEHLASEWSGPKVLPWIFYILNQHVSYETGISPFESHFGSEDISFFGMPNNIDEKDYPTEYVKSLNQNLQLLRKKFMEFQQELIKERTKDNNLDKQNIFQKGDFVLFKPDSSHPRTTKLSPQYYGPYVVISQSKNDVSVRHMASGVVREIHVESLKRYIGTEVQARAAADGDYGQYSVVAIDAYRGDPTNRSEMEFRLVFADGDTVWKQYSKDIFTGQYFEDFCYSRMELRRLLTTEKQSKIDDTNINKMIITAYVTNTNGYMNLRFFGYEKYSNFGLNNHESINYFIPVAFRKLDKDRKAMLVQELIHNKSWMVKHKTLTEYFFANVDFISSTNILLMLGDIKENVSMKW
jgi:hypothetical protein